MQITRIDIADFRNIKRLSLITQADTLLFCGKNGSMKSSLRKAIAMCLFGRCEDTDARGAGADALIRDHAKSAEISIDIALNAETTAVLTTTLDRRGKKTFQCMIRETGEMPDEAQTREGFWSMANVSMRHAMVAAMPGAMVTGVPGSDAFRKDMSDILADYLSGDIDLKKLEFLCDVDYPGLLAFAKEHSIGAVPGILKTAEDFAHVGSTAESIRKDVNRGIKEADQEIGIFECEQPVNPAGALIDPVKLPDYEKRIEEVRGMRDAVMKELALAEAAPTGESNAAEITALRESVTTAEFNLGYAVSAAADAATKFNAATAAVDAANAKHTMSVHNSSVAGDKVAALKKSLEALNSKQTCDTCGQKLSKELRATLTEPAETALAEAVKVSTVRAAESGKCLDALSAAREAAKAARDTKDDQESALADARAAAVKAQAALDAMPKPYEGRPAETVRADIESLDARIDKGNEIVKQLTKYASFIAAKARRAALGDSGRFLDWCVKSFRDGEITKQLIADGMAAFQARVNAELSPMAFNLTVDSAGKVINLLLKTPDAYTARLAILCSTGEQKILEFCIALAFADTGAPVMVDEINVLDHERAAALLKRLKKKSGGSSVFAFMALTSTAQDVGKLAKALAPVEVYSVGSGEITRVDDGAARVEVLA